MTETITPSASKARVPQRLIQLVPRFRPDADGVGECALTFGDALFKSHGIRSDFIAYNSPKPNSTLDMPNPLAHTLQRLGGGEAGPLNRALDALIANSSEPPVLILHYVSYGYSPSGIPWWLPGSLERFLGKGGRLVGLFHELFATGSFPSRTFFTSWLQRRIFRRLLAHSEAAFTSNEEFLASIERENKWHRPVNLIGICSNVGEPERPGPLALRRRRLAVFGQFFGRKSLYSLYLPVLRSVANHLGIEEIADIGPVDDPDWMRKHVYRGLGSLVHSYGTQTAAATSMLLEDSILGVVAYRYAMRWKSGIIAAYQAHAMPVLLFPNRDEVEPEPRQPGDWCLSADQLFALAPGSLVEMQSAATAGYQNYQRFRSSRLMVETILPALLQQK
jgi:hypothetical protein